MPVAQLPVRLNSPEQAVRAWGVCGCVCEALAHLSHPSEDFSTPPVSQQSLTVAPTGLADHLSCLEKRERESARASVSHFLTRTAVDVSVGVSNSTFHPKCVCGGR